LFQIENYLPLPVGRGREPIKSLKRADYIILNKVNLATSEKVTLILKAIEQASEDSRFNLPTINLVEVFDINEYTRTSNIPYRSIALELFAKLI